MAENQLQGQQPAKQASTAVLVKQMISQENVRKKFAEVLGQKAPQFLASITTVVQGSAQLKKCDANSIMSAAFVAATYDLPIDPNLGFPRNGIMGNQLVLVDYRIIHLLIISRTDCQLDKALIHHLELRPRYFIPIPRLRIVDALVIRNDCRKTQVRINRQIVCCRHQGRADFP